MNATTKVLTPEVEVRSDYNDTFKKRVESAIELNQKSNTPMVNKIVITAGPYRSYCMGYNRVSHDTVELDFYSASRVFGFEHTIEDIAKAIRLPLRVYK